MINKLRLIRSKIATILVVLMCINSFAAVVGDNDGAAFITKAEFESLKNDFQTQINRYNTSLDSKIDGAIGNYVNGIKTARTVVVNPIIKAWDKVRWMSGPYMYMTRLRFTALSTTAGNYTDTSGWMIPQPDNHRQISWDDYAWSHDNIRANFKSWRVSFQLAPSEWPDGLGNARESQSGKGYPPTLYIQGDIETTTKNGVKIHSITINRSQTPIVNEVSFQNYLDGTPHSESSWDAGAGTIALGNQALSSNHLSITNIGVTNDILGLQISNIPRGTATFSGTTHVTKANNPYYPQTTGNVACYIDGGRALVTSLKNNRGDPPSGQTGLVSDWKWKTNSQYIKDLDNIAYAMWGKDIDDSLYKMNAGPYQKRYAQGYGIDLSESGNAVTYKCSIYNVIISYTCPWFLGAGTSQYVFDQSPILTNNVYNSIPLFYRISWNKIKSKDLPTTSGTYLYKSQGMPILQDATEAGTLRINLTWKETATVDTSYITITPDQKIKTYFKNGSFDDDESTYVRGYTNLKSEGTAVLLNGQEWKKKTDGTYENIQVSIPVKKGDSIWMRIDPNSADGTYCLLTKYDVTLLTE